MAREILGIPPPKITFEPIVDIEGPPKPVGTNIILHTTPPLEVHVYPKHIVRVRSEDFTLEIKGRSQIGFRHEGITIDTTNETASSRTLLTNSGSILFARVNGMKAPNIPNEVLASLHGPDSNVLNDRERYDLYAQQVSLDEPESFQIMSFGHTVRYLREHAGYTQRQLANNIDYSLSSVIRLENGTTRTIKREKVLLLLDGLGILQDKTKRQILEAAFEREKQLIEHERVANRIQFPENLTTQ